MGDGGPARTRAWDWNATELERKLGVFQEYYNHSRVHAAVESDTPAQVTGKYIAKHANLEGYRWQSHCCNLVQTTTAA